MFSVLTSTFLWYLYCNVCCLRFILRVFASLAYLAYPAQCVVGDHERMESRATSKPSFITTLSSASKNYVNISSLSQIFTFC